MEAIKKDMTRYWSQRVEKFSALRCREMDSEKYGRWLDELTRRLPAGRKLNILDIGTGTGFFAFLLAQRGHTVTGIDLTPSMVAEAERMAELLHISVDFRVMDAEEPDFPAHSFDAIVTRKLTWTLPHLSLAYRRWHALLKPGGRLINFDADYCREDVPASLPARHAHQGIGTALMEEYARMKETLRPMQNPRPQWDVNLLADADFDNISVDTGVWQRIYREIDEFYDPTPGFAITATA